MSALERRMATAKAQRDEIRVRAEAGEPLAMAVNARLSATEEEYSRWLTARLYGDGGPMRKINDR